MEQLLKNDITDTVKNIAVSVEEEPEYNGEAEQLSLFGDTSDEKIKEDILSIDIGRLTPIEAINKLYELQNKVKASGGVN